MRMLLCLSFQYIVLLRRGGLWQCGWQDYRRIWMQLWSCYLSLEVPFQSSVHVCVFGVGVDLPCLTKVWLVSRRISQPSTIIRSMARFFLMFSVSLTSSCMILKISIHLAHSHHDIRMMKICHPNHDIV